MYRELLGITLDNAHLLLEALKQAAIHEEAVAARQDKYGQRYVIDFDFIGPDGRVTIRAAWIIRSGEELPRLVTCYIL